MMMMMNIVMMMRMTSVVMMINTVMMMNIVMMVICNVKHGDGDEYSDDDDEYSERNWVMRINE